MEEKKLTDEELDKLIKALEYQSWSQNLFELSQASYMLKYQKTKIERLKIDLKNEKNWGKIQTKQAIKDTAKEILHLIKSSEYVDSLKTISIWAVEKIFKERYGVEVE